ncbi:ABC transporter substrate-binding protein [Paenibacillus sp. UNC451MF]|uniref:ABC transporter substrate-binding protein n=1 Tax=Paenibacillus sp. UNC451MF TaxID=1449063 RepID=UPI000491DA00|nr:hypothetical protein [Paenibacillus sp. UNC451MF]
MKTLSSYLISISLLLAVLSGCSDNKENISTSDNVTTVASKDPVKLIVYSYSTGMTDSEFQKYFIDPVQKKYPNVSFEYIINAGGANTPDELLAAGKYPDILLISDIYIGMFKNLGMIMNLSDMVKKNAISLDRFDASTIEAIKQYGNKDELYGLPLSMNYGITAYNKDIFDKFGVAYPQDLMTWNELLEIGKKLTILDQGTQYIGMDPGNVDQMKEQYAIPYMNEKQDAPILNSADYQKLFGLLKQFYEVPGFIGNNNTYTYGRNAFVKNKTVAMLPAWADSLVGMLEDEAKRGQPLNWDFVTQPVFADQPGKGRPTNMAVLTAFPKSPNIEMVFQVMSTLVSDEAQTEMNKNGKLTVLNDKNIQLQFGANLKSFQNKNIPAITKLKRSKNLLLTDYDVELKKVIQESAKDMALSGKDVNTVLREAQEKAEKKVNEIKLAKK